MDATTSDRRSSRRHSLKIPLRLRIWGTPGPEQRAESVDLSERGALLETRLPLLVGTALDLRLNLPEEMTGQPTTEWRCRGRVIRVAPRISLQRSAQVGVHFDWLQVLRP